MLGTTASALLAVCLCAGPAAAQVGGLTAGDREICFTVPATSKLPVPLELGSSVRARYSVDQAAGLPSLGTVALEEGVKYPPLPAGVYSGSAVGEHVIAGVRDGTPVSAPNSLYFRNWLTRQWVGVDFSLAHTHLVERTDEELEFGVSRTFAVFADRLFLCVGQYWFDDLSSRYRCRTTDVSVDYGWRRWDVTVFAESSQDSTTRQQTVGAAISRKF